MIDRKTFAAIGSMAELRRYRHLVDRELADSYSRLDERRQQLTSRLTPNYILGYVATRTESVIAMAAIARRLYNIARNAIARMKKG